MKTIIETYQDAGGQYRFRVIAGENGEIIATGENHTRPGDARRAGQGLEDRIRAGDVVYRTAKPGRRVGNALGRALGFTSSAQDATNAPARVPRRRLKTA